MLTTNIPPSAIVSRWRNTPEAVTEALDDFLFWLEYDHPDNQNAPTDEELTAVKKWVDTYLQRDPQTIAQAEQAMLAGWIANVDLPQD